jgi:hypothetical protein
MKRLLILAAALSACGSILAAEADAKAEVKAAAKKLADKGNYSFTTTTKFEGGPGNFRPGPTDGQTDAGLIYLKSTFGERTIESLVRGDKAATKTEDGWQNVDELEGNRAFMARRLKTYKAPAQEADSMADKSKNLKKDAGAIAGDMTEDGAKDLLSFGRRPNPDSNRPAPKDARGTVKFWLKDGALTKFEYNVQGKVTGRDDQEMTVNRTTTVEIKDVGTTKLSVPDEAKKKL